MTTPVTRAKIARLEREFSEVLGSSSAGLRPRDLASWADRPKDFITTVLHGTVHLHQLQIIEAVSQHRKVAVRACHSSGKDWTAARIALWWVYALGGRVLCTAPTAHQLVDILFNAEFRRAFRDEATPPGLYGDLFQTKLQLKDEPHAGIIGLVSSKEARLTGLHAPRTLVLITEANGVPDYAYEDLSSDAVGEDDRVLALGNPLASTTGWFRRAFQRDSGWHPIKISAQDIFDAGINVPGGVSVPGMISPTWVEEKRREYGERSPFYVAKVLAEFADANGENAITTRADLDKAAARYELAAARQPRNVPFALGVDVGREGDPSAVCWHQQDVVHGVECFPTPTGLDAADAADAVLGKIRELQSDPYGLGSVLVAGLVIDAIGVGASAVDLLNEASVPLTEFRGNAKALDDHFANARAEAYGLLATRLRKGELHVRYDEELWDELLALTWFANDRGKVQMLDKRDARAVLGRSPNRADALAMAVYEMATGASVGGSTLTF